MSANRQHGGAPPSGRRQVPEPTLAERARTLLHVARLGTLCTNSRKHPGWPFGSLMPYTMDSHGHPLLLVSSMAVHAQNLSQDTRASLFVAQPGVTGDPLGAARVTLMGELSPAGPEARPLYLEVHETAQAWIDFDDFSLLQMEIRDIYFIGGFGVMGWVGVEEYERARPDPLADAAPRIIEHMNADHAGALLAIARAFAGLEADEVRMTAIDRLGFEARVKTGERVHGTRIPFLAEVATAGESRTMLVEMARRAAAGVPQSEV